MMLVVTVVVMVWGLRAGEGSKEYKNEKAIIQGSSTYIIDTFLHFTKNKRDSQDWPGN